MHEEPQKWMKQLAVEEILLQAKGQPVVAALRLMASA